MTQKKIDYQKIQSLKSKAFDANREVELIKREVTKILEPYNAELSKLEKEILEYLKQIEEEESKIKK